jgi:hypothetical protein
MSRQTRIDRFNFRGAHAPPLVASRQGRWCKADTSAAGAPTVQTGSSGAMELTLAADNEVENLTFYTGDVLPYDVDDIVRFRMLMALSASLPAAVSAAWGMTSARNDAIDSIAAALIFRAIGNNTVLAESDDGVTDVDDISTGGETLTTTPKWFEIDLSEGGLTQSPPSLSLSAKADARYFITNANGSKRRVAAGQRFRIDGYTAGLQFFCQLQKTAAASVATLYAYEFEIEYRLPR